MTVARQRYERWCRLLLRAFPRRWRSHYAPELLVVLLDLAPAGARRPDLRTAADLLRSGWTVRWRSRPPFWRWVLYRLLDIRLPVAHRSWVADDTAGFAFPLRQGAGTLLLLVPVWALTAQDLPVQLASLYVTAYCTMALVFRRGIRRNARNRHLPTIHPAAWGSAEWPEPRPVGSEPRRRVAAGRWVTISGTGVLVGAAALLTLAALAEGGQVLLTMAVALGAGVVCGLLVLALGRRLRGRPAQPYRHVIKVPTAAPVVVTLLPVAVIATVALITPALAWGTGLLGVAVGPVVLAAGLASGRQAGQGPPVALIDLARVLRGRGRLVVDAEVLLWTNPYTVARPSERWTRGQDGGPSPVA